MNSFSEAVKLAIANGWKRPEPCEVDGIQLYHKGDAVLDPLFWKGLGTALSWPTALAAMAYPEHQVEKVTYSGVELKTGIVWKDVAMSYFLIHMDDGDEEQFFNELLKGKV